MRTRNKQSEGSSLHKRYTPKLTAARWRVKVMRYPVRMYSIKDHNQGTSGIFRVFSWKLIFQRPLWTRFRVFKQELTGCVEPFSRLKCQWRSAFEPWLRDLALLDKQVFKNLLQRNHVLVIRTTKRSKGFHGNGNVKRIVNNYLYRYILFRGVETGNSSIILTKLDSRVPTKS